MAKISLRMYNREIEGLIEQEQRLDEAIAHCRHILKTYPKHLETYRLLGKAYLEAKRYDSAVDIFQRVLVVVPDDFVSHVGMSIIADDKGRLDDAIWHMERAFEVQPSNAAIQAELQRLFGRRDGVEPPKIRLTRGALAHMYVQGELFPQAISEIRAVLANDPKRTDMQTLLARAYYRNGQKAEATELCTELLSKYLNCLDANRLMAEIAPGTQRAAMATEYRQRVIELDPYAAFAQDSLFNADNVADNLVTIERLEYTGVTAEMPGALAIGLEPETAPSARTPMPGAAGTSVPSNLPAWLQGVREETPPAAPSAPPPSQEDIPDFLRKAGWGASSEARVEQAPAMPEQPQAAPETGGAVEGELPEWVKALAPKEEPPAAAEPTPPSAEQDMLESKSPSSQAFPSDVPDWLRDLGPTPAQPPAPAPELPQATAGEPTLPPDVPDWLRDLGPAPSAEAPVPPEAPEETPDWLKDLVGRDLDEPAATAKKESESDWMSELQSEQAAPAPTEPAEESPEWLKEFDNDLETPLPKTTRLESLVPPTPPVESPQPAMPEPDLGSLGTTAQEQDDAMAWLESLAAKHGAKPEELVTDPNARTDVAPEWVDKAKEIGQQATETPPLSDETGMWLRGLEEEAAGTSAPASPPPVPEPAEEQPFDFRTGFEDQSIFTEPAPEPHKEEPPAALPSDTPDWLREFTDRSQRTGMEDAPEWLRGISQEEPPSEEEQPTSMPEANVPTARLRPLSESEPPAPPSEPVPAEESTDLPAWLAGLDREESAESQVPSAEQPSDELPAWLRSEIEPEPEAKQPANPADWHPAQLKSVEAQPEPPELVVQPPPPSEEVQQPVSEIPAEPVKPPELEQQPPQPVEEEKPAPVPGPVSVEAQPPVEQPAPPPARPRVPAAKAPMPSLGDAQFQLGRGNISAAVDMYGKLIRKGKSLEDIIRDLRDALYRYPVEVPLWQSLGDAYMRANRLQEALDAYTKAEELLR